MAAMQRCSWKQASVVASVLGLLVACGTEEIPPPSGSDDDKSEANDEESDDGDESRKDGGSDKRDSSTKEPSRKDASTEKSEDTKSDAGAKDAEGDWCKVKPVLDQYCTSCHDGEGTAGAPFALLTHSDWTKASPDFPDEKIYERAAVRMKDKKNPMPPSGELEAEELALVEAWFADGAPGSDSEECAPAETDKPAEAAWPPPDCDEMHQLRANSGGGKFKVRKGQFYQDFMFTPPWEGDKQAVGFRAIVDNKKVLHHYIVYQGGAFLVGWSPGKNDHVMPDDIGVYMPSNGELKMTVHYYNEDGTGTEEDESGVEVCLTNKKRPKTAVVMPFAANPAVPAQAKNLEIKSTCTVRSSEPVTIITSSPHMHGLGVGAKLSVQRTDGTTEVLHDKSFNFEEQTTWGINATVNNGDRITTTCVYSNDTNQRVGFGLNTEDEMCFNFALYYPMCGMTCVPDDPLAAVFQVSQGGGCPASPGAAGSSGGSSGGLFGGLLSN